ncbi:hypothetical protein QOZ80_3BG0253640 [Eleusine coracana subsp. coracana]|nr:hypothetical protein QOZ80_3BG0253640 [Eleusine coracana subsp. coracana]
MANLFDLLDLADGESGAAAVSVLVTKKKAEAAAAEAAAKAEAEAARLAAKEEKRAVAIANAKAYAIQEIRRRRAVPENEEVKFTDREIQEIREAVAEAECEADQEKEPRPKISFYDITQKQKDKRNCIDEQIQLFKEHSKLLEGQISLLDKQRKLAEENTEDVYTEAQIKLAEEQTKLADEQRKLEGEQLQRLQRKKILKEELGEHDVKHRGKELHYENNGSYQGYSHGYDERQTEGRQYYSGQRQGNRGGKARRQNRERNDRAVSDAGTDAEQKPEIKVAPASSEIVEQKAGAVNGEAVPASGSETSTADKPKAKNKLSGSQKRKKKRDGVAGSKKDAGSEMDKAQQNSEKIGTEPKSYFEEEKKVTLDEYEKVRGEKKKSLAATTNVVRKISAEEFKGLQLLEKKADDEEAIKVVEKEKHKEKAEKVQQGAENEGQSKVDPKKVATSLFKHAPRPRYQDDRYDRGYNGQGPRGDNSNDSRGSGRGYNVAGNNGNGAPRGGGYSGRGDGAQRGGYSGRGNGGYQGAYYGRGNGGYQSGYNGTGNGQYQQRASGDYQQGGGYRGRGNGRPQQPRTQEEEFKLNFPALSGKAAPAPTSAPAPAPASSARI